MNNSKNRLIKSKVPKHLKMFLRLWVLILEEQVTLINVIISDQLYHQCVERNQLFQVLKKQIQNQKLTKFKIR